MCFIPFGTIDRGITTIERTWRAPAPQYDAGFSGRAAAVRLGIQLRLDQARRVRSGSAAGESY